MRRRLLAAVVTVLLVTLGTGVAAAGVSAQLRALGPTQVQGTDATAVFAIGERTVRQVRYQDRRTLEYSFVLANDGPLPVTVLGLGRLDEEPQLFRYLELTDEAGEGSFTLGPGERETVRLSMRMHGCEHLSARAGSFAHEVALRTARAGVVRSVVHLSLPEEIHTGSAREASCPRSTATSRPPG